MTNLISAQDAFRAAQRAINERCQARGVESLTDKDIPIIAAWTPFEHAYNNTLSRLTTGQEERFNAECVQFAIKCIATAILAGSSHEQ